MIKELSIEFEGIGEVRGYHFLQISKSDHGYIYQRTRVGQPTTYEVFKRTVNERFGTVSYPGSPSFGLWAWNTHSLDRAKEILNSFEDGGSQ